MLGVLELFIKEAIDEVGEDEEVGVIFSLKKRRRKNTPKCGVSGERDRIVGTDGIFYFLSITSPKKGKKPFAHLVRSRAVERDATRRTLAETVNVLITDGVVAGMEAQGVETCRGQRGKIAFSYFFTNCLSAAGKRESFIIE